ncbi:membrane protein [Nonomuraea soli]
MSHRLVRLYTGLTLYGLAIALQIKSALGGSPWDVFHQGLAVHFGLSVGTWVIIVGAAVMVVWIPLKQKPGLGTISNVFLVGLACDAGLWLLPSPHVWPLQWLYLVSGILLLAFASVLYIGAKLGPGPRDGIMTGLVRLGLSVRLARFLIEITVLSIGWLLGGTAGIGTLLFALAIGPLVQQFSRKFPLS